MDAIIFDIDGTLANCDHRRVFLPDWDRFFAEMDKDTPNHDVVWLAESLPWGGRADIVAFVVTGRPEKYREITTAWLQRHATHLPHTLLMRPDGDFRSDVVVKREILQGIQGQGYDVRLVIDDRPSVVAMWRSEGLTCLQANEGFREVTYAPGDLHVMVGPSGAGKSHWAAKRFRTHDVVSSDNIRQTVCGDFRDQSQNSQVFAAFHAIIRARLDSGLKTIADATNIKTADRRRLLDLAPPGCKITYHVFDRPMRYKIVDGGWRNEITVKGKPLMAYHEDVFNSNLGNILAGDDDPRVTVMDHRV